MLGRRRVLVTACLRPTVAAMTRTMSVVPGVGTDAPSPGGSASASQESDELVSVPIADIPSGWKGVKRFYDHVGVRPVDSSGTECMMATAAGFKVLIQGRELRTNGMHDLVVPTYALALAIAGEFAAQGDMIHPPSTPLYNLACMAIDCFGADGLVPVPHEKDLKMTETEKLQSELVEFLETDTVCYRVAPDVRDPADALLRKRQDKHYDPLVKWFEEKFGGPLCVSYGLSEVIQPPNVFPVMQQFVAGSDIWLKAALRQALTTVKSSVIALAFLHRHISVEQTTEACRVEEEFQIEENGFVEDGHDTTRAFVRVNLTSVASFLWLLPASKPPVIAPATPSSD